jgi:ribosome-associated toxin RatA of RatAB toxin-antitoxin module
LFHDLKRVIRHARLVGCALLAASVADAVAAEGPDLSWLDWQALSAGEVLVRADRDVQPLTVQVKLAALVASSAQAIWDVLVACQIAPEYVPNVVSCRSLELVDDGKAQLFVQTVKPAFFLPTFEHVFRLDYQPYERIDVHRVSGPIALMEGSWWLLPQEDGKILLVYQLAVDPGLPVPRFFVRATMKRDLPRVVEAVRERAEATR